MSKLHKPFVLRSAEVWKRLVAFVRANNTEANPLMIIVTEAEKPRTLAQNAYARAVVREIADKAWVGGKQYSADAWWELLAREYGVVEEIALPDGTVASRRRSTTELSAQDFSEFIENIKAYAAGELGIELDV